LLEGALNESSVIVSIYVTKHPIKNTTGAAHIDS